MRPNFTDLERMYLERADAVEYLQTLPAECVDLVVTDPAYESLEKHRAVGTTTRLKVSKQSSNAWFPIFPNHRFRDLFVELHRVMKTNTHFYMMSDQETMFVAKPIAESCGFKFWKPLVWDKCLDPATLVRTTSGVRRIGEVDVGDFVINPEGEPTQVIGKRRCKAPSVEVRFSDGISVVCSAEHLFQLQDGQLQEARNLSAGDILASAPGMQPESFVHKLRVRDLIPSDALICRLPPTTTCLWCSKEFDSARAASAHQARHCKSARTKEEMSSALGVTTKRLMWWMSKGQIPYAWAAALCISDKLTGEVRAMFSNDSALTFPEEIALDYSLGKLVGLYASQGFRSGPGVGFSFNAGKRDSHAHVARYARCLGLRSSLSVSSENGVVVSVGFQIMQWLLRHFVGGESSPSKFFKPSVYEAPSEFRDGVFDGLLDGDGHWEWNAQRDSFSSTSSDLAFFALRHAKSRGWSPHVRRIENDSLGAWVVAFDRKTRGGYVQVESIEPVEGNDLIDIAINGPHLYQLADGIVTHNCTIGMGYHYRARYELILFFEKGKRRLANLGTPDILSVPRIRNGYPTEKPASLMQILIEQSSAKDEIVLDPFFGSGSVGVAALQTGRRFLGCDISPDALSVATERLMKEV